MSMKTSDVKFKERIHIKMQDAFMRQSVANAQERMFANRQKAAEKLGHWEDWRQMGMDIRNHVLENLDYYLTQLSDNVSRNGGHVFFAKTAKMPAIILSRLWPAKTPKRL